nr:replication protein A 70 kDa DNA-binding subunit-like [Ipomoea batatas]
MAPMYVLVEELQKHHTSVAIRLRVVRTYNVLHSRGRDQIKSRECVFHDEAGSYIRMHISRKSVSHLNDFVEGNVYCIKNFLVVAHWYCYKTCHDVIGRVVEIYSPLEKMINGRPSRLIDFLIEDLKGNQVECTAWDDHVEKVMPFFRSDLLEPMVVIIQMGQIKLVEKCIESDPNDWYYDSCPQQNCSKKLEFNAGMYDCGKCGGRFIKGSLRYKLKIRVVDVNGTTPLLLWDHETLELLCVKADELKAMQPSVMTKIPKEMRNLKGRGLFFKLAVRSDQLDNLNNALPVMQVKHFPEMFEIYCHGLIKHNDDEFSSKLQLTEDASDSDENVAVNEMEAVKRSLLDEFSSTQTSKKKKQIVVKEEKDDKEPTAEH